MTNRVKKLFEEYPEDSKDTCKECAECSTSEQVNVEDAYHQKCDQVFDECWEYQQCSGCPFENDPNAFCKRYLLYSIPADQLDGILDKFKEMKS